MPPKKKASSKPTNRPATSSAMASTSASSSTSAPSTSAPSTTSAGLVGWSSPPKASLPLAERQELARDAWTEVRAVLAKRQVIGWRPTTHTWHYPLGTLRGPGSVSYPVHITVDRNDLYRAFMETFVDTPGREPMAVLRDVFAGVLYHLTIEISKNTAENPHWYSLPDEDDNHWTIPEDNDEVGQVAWPLAEGTSDMQTNWEILQGEAERAVARLSAL